MTTRKNTLNSIIKSTALTLLFLLSGLFGSTVFAQDDDTAIQVHIDGKLQSYEQPPIIVNGSTVVPLRGIFEAMGATITWDPTTKTVVATKGEKTIKLTIDRDVAEINGQTIKLDQPATIINQSTMVPARFVSEALGGKVEWVSKTRTVLITTTPASAVAVEDYNLSYKLSSILPQTSSVDTVQHKFTTKLAWKSFQTKYFQIYYYINENDVFILSQEIDKLYEDIIKKFGHKVTSDKIPVYFLKDSDYDDNTSVKWSSASWNSSEKTMFVEIADNKVDIDLKLVTIKHELTHAVTLSSEDSQMKNTPTWFREGVATFSELSAPFYNVIREYPMYKAFTTGTMISLKDIPMDNRKWKSEETSTIYSQAQSFYGFLVNTYGESNVNDMWYTNGDFKTIMDTLTGKNIEQLEIDWKHYLDKQYTKDETYRGVISYSKGTKYVGDVKHGASNGQGKKYKDGRLYYEGGFKENDFEGTGTYYYADGGKYVGEFNASKITGKGKSYDKDGFLFYEGEFKDGKIQGRGTIYYTDGFKYSGELSDGISTGSGSLYSKDGKLLYDGQWKDNNFDGQGTIYFTDGSKYSGAIVSGKPNGMGKAYNMEGTFIYEGEFSNGTLVKKKE
jgi:hypothetical protein